MSSRFSPALLFLSGLTCTQLASRASEHDKSAEHLFKIFFFLPS